MKPLILSADTTHEYGSLALLEGDDLIEELSLHAPAGFAHVLYGCLAALLERHTIKLHSIDCFASASGPGSFTGVRVGLACIKGLAEAAGKPAVAISNLQALSCFGTAPLRAVLLDARRGDVYGGLYDDRAQPLAPEVVSKLEAWLATLPSADLEFISPDHETFRGALPAGANLIAAPRSVAAAIGRLAAARFRAGAARDPAELDANYVRRSDAELFWKE